MLRSPCALFALLVCAPVLADGPATDLDGVPTEPHTWLTFSPSQRAFVLAAFDKGQTAELALSPAQTEALAHKLGKRTDWAWLWSFGFTDCTCFGIQNLALVDRALTRAAFIDHTLAVAPSPTLEEKAFARQHAPELGKRRKVAIVVGGLERWPELETVADTVAKQRQILADQDPELGRLVATSPIGGFALNPRLPKGWRRASVRLSVPGAWEPGSLLLREGEVFPFAETDVETRELDGARLHWPTDGAVRRSGTETWVLAPSRLVADSKAWLLLHYRGGLLAGWVFTGATQVWAGRLTWNRAAGTATLGEAREAMLGLDPPWLNLYAYQAETGSDD